MPADATTGAVQDATRGNWVDQYAPAVLRPYLRLARADRPVGSWLLFLPCLWSVLLALLPGHAVETTGSVYPDFLVAFWLVTLFAIGSVAMRGAGCTYNDIIDRDIDGQVERTRSRPIPSGQVSVKGAALFLLFQGLVGLAVLLQLNRFTFWLGLSSLLVVLVYPFMKRITNWPQAVLGAAFAWGALVGWAAVRGELSLAPVLLYLGTVSWIIGYDTIYAHQDREDDALLGLKSTALNFGEQTGKWLAFFYGLTFFLTLAAGMVAGAGWLFYIGMIAVGLHMAWQVRGLDIHDGDDCLMRFKSNRDLGLLVSLALVLDIASHHVWNIML